MFPALVLKFDVPVLRESLSLAPGGEKPALALSKLTKSNDEFQPGVSRVAGIAGPEELSHVPTVGTLLALFRSFCVKMWKYPAESF